jgi:hypothetical protein
MNFEQWIDLGTEEIGSNHARNALFERLGGRNGWIWKVNRY